MSEKLQLSTAYENVSEEEKEIGLEIEKLLIGLSVSSAQYLLSKVGKSISEKSKVSPT